MNFMPALQLQLPQAQRAKGELSLSFRHHSGITRVAEFYQSGCLKTRLPRPQNPAIAEAVTLNISGGVAGGDTLSTCIEIGPHARLSIASQAAERIYRALAEPARITTRITVQAGATAEYLPQETIFFDGFALTRSLDIHLDETANFLGLESYIFGRRAMGETVASGFLRDRITLNRHNKPILQDMTRLDGDISAKLSRRATAGGATAMATLILAGPGASTHLPALRAALAGAQAGASAFEGIILARLLAPDSFSLKKSLRAALAAIRGTRPLPRVWQG